MERKVVYGSKWKGLLVSYDHAGSCWKMCQPLLASKQVQYTGECLKTWPKQGTMLNGIASEQMMLDSPIVDGDGSVSVGWPTPTAIQRPCEGNMRLYRKQVLAGELSEEDAMIMLNGKSPFEAHGKLKEYQWPTPCASDHRDRGNRTNPAVQRRRRIGKQASLSMIAKGKPGLLCQEKVGSLMGFPPNWTDITTSKP